VVCIRGERQRQISGRNSSLKSSLMMDRWLVGAVLEHCDFCQPLVVCNRSPLFVDVCCRQSGHRRNTFVIWDMQFADKKTGADARYVSYSLKQSSQFVCELCSNTSRGSLVITRYQSLPLTPRKVLPIYVLPSSTTPPVSLKSFQKRVPTGST